MIQDGACSLRLGWIIIVIDNLFSCCAQSFLVKQFSFIPEGPGFGPAANFLATLYTYLDSFGMPR